MNMNEYFETYIKPLNDELERTLDDNTRTYELTWEVAVRKRRALRNLQNKENGSRLNAIPTTRSLGSNGLKVS